jgi:hypothetical protein
MLIISNIGFITFHVDCSAWISLIAPPGTRALDVNLICRGSATETYGMRMSLAVAVQLSTLGQVGHTWWFCKLTQELGFVARLFYPPLLYR